MDHVCDRECQFLNRDSAWVCRVTGKVGNMLICFNEISGAGNDLECLPAKRITGTNGKKRYARSTRAPPEFKEEKVKAEIETFVTSLLYSEMRSECQHQKVKRAAAVETIKNVHHKKRRVVMTLVRDEKELGVIVQQVFDILQMINDSKPFTKKRPVILGSLFLMQHGKSFETRSGKTFQIVRSEYLWQHLPSISDLSFFGLEKSLVRVGKNVIQSVAREL